MTSSPLTEMSFLESVTHTYVTSDSPQDRLIKTLAIRFKPGGFFPVSRLKRGWQWVR